MASFDFLRWKRLRRNFGIERRGEKKRRGKKGKRQEEKRRVGVANG